MGFYTICVGSARVFPYFSVGEMFFLANQHSDFLFWAVWRLRKQEGQTAIKHLEKPQQHQTVAHEKQRGTWAMGVLRFLKGKNGRVKWFYYYSFMCEGDDMM